MTTAEERKAVLLLEFDRMKQRADYLDRMLQGHDDAWGSLKAMIPNGTELVIDKAVTEARQTATALASLAKTIASLGDEKPVAVPADPLQKIKDDLAEKRAARAL